MSAIAPLQTFLNGSSSLARAYAFAKSIATERDAVAYLVTTRDRSMSWVYDVTPPSHALAAECTEVRPFPGFVRRPFGSVPIGRLFLWDGATWKKIPSKRAGDRPVAMHVERAYTRVCSDTAMVAISRQ